MLVLLALVLLTLVGGVTAYLVSQGVRASGQDRVAIDGFFCAESGLVAGRRFFAANVAQWNAILGGGGVAGYPVTGSISGSGPPDFRVTITDNSDELPPLQDNPLVDNDLTVVIHSQCIRSGIPALQLDQFFSMGGDLSSDYRNQGGKGARNANNQN